MENRRRRRDFAPGIARLEDRSVPSAAVTASLAGGVLRINGTEGADQVEIRSITTTGRLGRAQIDVVGVARFPAANVRAVAINTGDGADAILITLNQPRFRAPSVRIDAGNGDDSIAISQQGPMTGKIRINAGDGDDTITYTAKKPDFVVVNPGAGWDTINGAIEPGAPRVSVSIATPPDVALSDWERQIVDLVNVERMNAGLPPLTVNTRLVDAARIQSAQMAQLDRMAHTLTDAALPSLSDRLKAAGYGGGGGENIAFNYRDPRDVMLGWMSSTGHRENILRASFRSIGVAVAFNAEGLPYYTQVFGSKTA